MALTRKCNHTHNSRLLTSIVTLRIVTNNILYFLLGVKFIKNFLSIWRMQCDMYSYILCTISDKLILATYIIITVALINCHIKEVYYYTR